MTRYILRAGYVRSTSDGDRHWIGAAQLASLYGLPPSKCVFIINHEALVEYRRAGEQPGDVHLRPRNDGDYRLPEERCK